MVESVKADYGSCSPDCSERCCGDTETDDNEYKRIGKCDYEEELIEDDDLSIKPPRATRATFGSKLAPTMPEAIVLTVDDARRQYTPLATVLSTTGSISAAVPADRYKADPSDRMDVEIVRALRYIGVEAASAIMIQRLASGRYEIDRRRIVLQWSGTGCTELFVNEEDVNNGAGAIPLAAYLRQAATIAQQTVPARRFLTFAVPGFNTSSPAERDSHRFESMELACVQARMREETVSALSRNSGR